LEILNESKENVAPSIFWNEYPILPKV